VTVIQRMWPWARHELRPDTRAVGKRKHQGAQLHDPWQSPTRRSGDPAEILEVTDIGEPSPPGPGQVQVRVSAFPDPSR